MRIVHAIAYALRRIAGAPDYAGYVAHLLEHHPGSEPLSLADFERQQLSARYERPGARCC